MGEEKTRRTQLSLALVVWMGCVLLVVICLSSELCLLGRMKELENQLEQSKSMLEKYDKRLEEMQSILGEHEKQLNEFVEMKEIWDELEFDRFKATSYAPHDSRTGIDHDGNPSRTATGVFPSRGTFAVNPRRIPYFSQMLVIGEDWFEHGQALDTGEAMRRNPDLIDVYRDTYEEARRFGRQDVLVFYRPPKE